MERFFFCTTSEGAAIAPALGVGDRAVESMSCSCQSLDQDLHLCHMGQGVRLLLPSAGPRPQPCEQHASEITQKLVISSAAVTFRDGVYFFILTLLQVNVLLI